MSIFLTNIKNLWPGSCLPPMSNFISICEENQGRVPHSWVGPLEYSKEQGLFTQASCCISISCLHNSAVSVGRLIQHPGKLKGRWAMCVTIIDILPRVALSLVRDGSKTRPLIITTFWLLFNSRRQGTLIP